MGLKEWATISRFKMEIATIVNPLIGILVASNSIKDLFRFHVLFYIIIYIFIIVSSSQINCYYDTHVDIHYKKNLYRATKKIGGRKIKISVVTMIFISLLLTIYLIHSGFLITSLLILAGIVIAISYSTPPFRLKARGTIGFVFLLIGIFALPVLGGWFLIRSSISTAFIAFSIGYAIMNGAFILINIAEDHEEDEKEGIKTISHVIGAENVPKASLLMLFIAFILIAFSLPFFLSPAYFVIFISIFFILYLFPIRDIYSIKKYGIKKYAPKVPIWFAVARYPLLLAIFIQFFA